ncbi:hypothetical protein B6U80_01890 [Candidatus Pacearchaeota archaeon ex4484_26]|nr:MAG: hypothetical protein B6U80_01890 [Candidatus Pacearchaeota archaeon ex4484_26]
MPVKKLKELKKEVKKVEEKHKQVKKEVHQTITFAISLIIFMLLVGTIFFHYFEGWTWVDSFYFSGTTITTLGYGDLVPSHTITKIFIVFYIIFTIGLVLYSASIIASGIIHSIAIYRIKNIWLSRTRKT